MSEFEDGDPDDIFTFGSSPTQSRSPESRIKVFVREMGFNARLFSTIKKKILMSQPEALFFISVLHKGRGDSRSKTSLYLF